MYFLPILFALFSHFQSSIMASTERPQFCSDFDQVDSELNIYRNNLMANHLKIEKYSWKNQAKTYHLPQERYLFYRSFPFIFQVHLQKQLDKRKDSHSRPIKMMITGDAHMDNFGVRFKKIKGHKVVPVAFMNDLDELAIGNPLSDLIRLMTSVLLKEESTGSPDRYQCLLEKWYLPSYFAALSGKPLHRALKKIPKTIHCDKNTYHIINLEETPFKQFYPLSTPKIKSKKLVQPKKVWQAINQCIPPAKGLSWDDPIRKQQMLSILFYCGFRTRPVNTRSTRIALPATPASIKCKGPKKSGGSYGLSRLKVKFQNHKCDIKAQSPLSALDLLDNKQATELNPYFYRYSVNQNIFLAGGTRFSVKKSHFQVNHSLNLDLGIQELIHKNGQNPSNNLPKENVMPIIFHSLGSTHRELNQLKRKERRYHQTQISADQINQLSFQMDRFFRHEIKNCLK
jgi:hypothetical protein